VNGLAAAVAAAALLVAAATPPPRAVRARPDAAGLAILISPEDYPPWALRAEQQGLVRVRLDIGKDGLATRCTVIESSNSAALDAATCRLLQRRARFLPARDRRGRRVADTFVQGIEWRIEQPPPMVVDGRAMWAACLDREARAHVTDRAAIVAILDRAFQACRPLETEALMAFNATRFGQRPVTELPKEYRESMRHSLAQVLLALRSPPR
jgi:TonB family protein